MKKLLAVRHVAFEDLGIFENEARAAGYEVEYRDAGVDELDAASDALVVMGGPISAYEEHLYPFLTAELKLIEARLLAGAPVLGICLGAQLMARALGARVYAGHGKEIGWSPVTLTAHGTALDPLAGIPVLHWHGDTFDLPTGAQHLASTPAYANQAFLWGRNALAVQFHPEVDASRLERWLTGHACELAHANVDLELLRRGGRDHGASLAMRGAHVFQRWNAALSF